MNLRVALLRAPTRCLVSQPRLVLASPARPTLAFSFCKPRSPGRAYSTVPDLNKHSTPEGSTTTTTTPPPSSTMRVTCQCGAVSFPTPTPTPLAVYHCHCTECRKQSASAYGTSAIFPARGLFPLPAELRERLGVWTRPANHGRTMDCYFCKACGVRVMHRIREPDGTERDTVSVKGGVVEGLVWEGAQHIYTRSAVVPVPEGAVKWEGPPTGMPGRKEP